MSVQWSFTAPVHLAEEAVYNNFPGLASARGEKRLPLITSLIYRSNARVTRDLTFLSTSIRLFAAAVDAKAPGRASQYLFCYFGAVSAQPHKLTNPIRDKCVMMREEEERDKA